MRSGWLAACRPSEQGCFGCILVCIVEQMLQAAHNFALTVQAGTPVRLLILIEQFWTRLYPSAAGSGGAAGSAAAEAVLRADAKNPAEPKTVEEEDEVT